jgi:CRISPR-associated endonuclease Cas1
VSYLDTKPHLIDSTQLSDEWAARSAYWMTETEKPQKPRRRRERNTKPLILCGHGVSLRIQNGSLVIRDGFTHYPQEQASHRFFRGDLSLPPRIVLIDGSGTLSFDVLTWLSEQGVSLVRIDWSGNVASVLSEQGYGADRAKVEWQIETRADNRRRLALSVHLIRQKIANSIDTLQTVFPSSAVRDRSCAGLRNELDLLTHNPPEDIQLLRGIEGRASATYFSAWQGVPLQWRATVRHPVPDAWAAIGPRSAIRAGKSKNGRASHPVNAMLNYAYAVLQSHLQIELLGEGYDPAIGIMHHASKAAPAFVFDLMEPSRPVVDAAILRFVLSTPLSGADFTLRRDGVCRVGAQLARRISAMSADIVAEREPITTQLQSVANFGL